MGKRRGKIEEQTGEKEEGKNTGGCIGCRALAAAVAEGWRLATAAAGDGLGGVVVGGRCVAPESPLGCA
ncbi:hypothetical protein PR202_gb08987 [Eleusine coracana subsp. coracana]|uniref:Uncharacterized protein n=1 Tax=Eleusine coracana subsp. coracana TaxID=191504 RepID=A0AAV5EGV8_ELECO|nr:hypothetical protein PR202_gb08987 [Eleusine coracana subsp. coracana]